METELKYGGYSITMVNVPHRIPQQEESPCGISPIGHDLQRGKKRGPVAASSGGRVKTP